MPTAEELAAGAVKVSVKDGLVVGSVLGATGAMPRIAGRMVTKPYSVASGDSVALVLPAYLDFLEKCFHDGVCTSEPPPCVCGWHTSAHRSLVFFLPR